MKQEKGEAAWVLDTELGDIQVALQKARQLCDVVSGYFDCDDPKQVAETISTEFNSMNLLPTVLFDYIVQAQEAVDDLVLLQKDRLGKPKNDNPAAD